MRVARGGSLLSLTEQFHSEAVLLVCVSFFFGGGGVFEERLCLFFFFFFFWETILNRVASLFSKSIQKGGIPNMRHTQMQPRGPPAKARCCPRLHPPTGLAACLLSRTRKRKRAMGQNPVFSVNIPMPTKIGSKMGAEFTHPKMGSHWL